jgi:hypothetical protein
MTTTRTTQTRTARPTVGSEPAPSWLSLLATSSLGLARAETLVAQVVAPGLRQSRGPLRLVVQTFDGDRRGRPLTSVQRSVTASELRHGVRVDVVDLSAKQNSARPVQVMAWVEQGEATLPFDGRRSEPGRGSLVGYGRSTGGSVSLELTAATMALAAE